jgi:hypothetical protein
MQEVYGVRVVGAVFLIDRSGDRSAVFATTAPTASGATHVDSGSLQGLDVVALYDAKQVEARVKFLRREELEAAVNVKPKL